MLSAQLSPEQITGREPLHCLLQELNIESIAATDAITHEGFAIVSRGLDAVALNDTDIGHPTLVDHRIETEQNSFPRESSTNLPVESLKTRSCNVC